MMENLKQQVIEELELIAKGESFRRLKFTSDGNTATFKLSHAYSSNKAKKLLEKIQGLESKQE